MTKLKAKHILNKYVRDYGFVEPMYPDIIAKAFIRLYGLELYLELDRLEKDIIEREKRLEERAFIQRYMEEDI